MKKLDIIHKIVSSQNRIGILNEVNHLLEVVNLKIQFQNSKYYTDDMKAKDSKRVGDIDKLKSIIKKHEEDKVKIDETIKILTARYKKERA